MKNCIQGIRMCLRSRKTCSEILCINQLFCLFYYSKTHETNYSRMKQRFMEWQFWELALPLVRHLWPMARHRGRITRQARKWKVCRIPNSGFPSNPLMKLKSSHETYFLVIQSLLEAPPPGGSTTSQVSTTLRSQHFTTGLWETFHMGTKANLQVMESSLATEQ